MTPRALPPERGDSPENKRPRRPRLVTWLLLVLLGFTAFSLRPVSHLKQLDHVQSGPPPVVAASGQLADAYELARPATLRIEARCNGRLFGHTPVGVGTGFFVNPQGQVLTAYHVVRAQAAAQHCPLRYVAVDHREREYRLELVGFDATRDIALLQANIRYEVPALAMAAKLPPRGSEIVAIGNSRGDFLLDRAGRVLRSNVRAVQADFASGTIELTASLAPGDSGGPVLTADGEVVGIVSYISFSSPTVETEGLLPQLLRSAIGRASYASYAVPVLAGSELLAGLQRGEQHDVPVIGFQLQYNYTAGQGDPGLGPASGVVVGNVQPGGPADLAGLRSYRARPVRADDGSRLGVSVEADVITRIDGRPVTEFAQLLEEVRAREIGSELVLTVQRGRETFELPVELAPFRAVFK